MNPRDDASLLERRDLLKLGGAAAVGLLTQLSPAQAATTRALAALPGLPDNPRTPAAMPTRNLGRTGYRVGIFSLGGQASLEKPNNAGVAVPIIERALDLGVNYLDTSARYGGAERWSEQYVGEVMRHRRAEAFLASKTHDRSRDGSLGLLDRSLELLHTDHLDLWQIHALSTMDELDKLSAKGGALEALAQAKEQKLVRAVGVTGHSEPKVLMEALRRFSFDTILLAVNAADRHHESFISELLPLAVEKELGIIGMKIPARGRLLSSYTPPPPEQQPSYGPKATRSGTMTMQEAFRYVLSLPVSTVIIGCDTIAQLEENVALARAFTPMSQTQLAALEERARPVHEQALFFRRWS